MKQKLKALNYSILARKGGCSLPLFKSDPERMEEGSKGGEEGSRKEKNENKKEG